ncbi:two-component system sensor histidine kinase CreC [Solilutibacter silvestris]|uniref:histidine kinase n=1 Tax=Solilutibacter silvestris TaxID=1645665 RepID=A0A2K1Q417_9GAMM|nr:two-component system sensor histidine kinase CreC [Lysobacter silvestris]PNS09785.1 Histidine kinase-, DNA gyrase B-, and HSP90-like ATPase [Lysobacter silvestris]
MKIGWRVLLGYFVIVAIAALLLGRVFLEQVKPAARQTAEDTLADTANTLAELASDDLASGHVGDGEFARSLRALPSRRLGAKIWNYNKEGVAYRVTITDARGIVVFDSEGRDLGRDNSRWNDVVRTLRGEYGARSTREDATDKTSSVMWVAAPIRHDGRLIGVLSVGKPNRVLQPFITGSRDVMLHWGLLLLGTALLIGIAMAWWLSHQLGILRRYALAVSDGQPAPLPRAAAEFGELGRALDSMRRQLDGKQYVEEYVHTLTHELKSPLAAIRGAAELLDTPMPEEDRARFIGHIHTQSERMAEMVDELLALAAVEHRRALEHPHPLRVQDVLDEAIAALEPKARQAGVTITRLGANDARVKGDAFLLRQALVNLLDNAVEFSAAGSGVDCTIDATPELVTIRIRDRGPGIPDYALPRVFERFYSLPRSEGGSRSHGLGLPFVAAVAVLHGGGATLDNADPGALATLTLKRD